ncbi:brassinosteroid insensitive 1-associated receptor kinase 1 [Vigna unguiculata]|uniref:non-specific serine/threonine protein kinase n=1 Tax=Vigna unguiculata TaxID=3917 RepID=A0A4D6N329_VIGUN|nr:brassinosteroid insensitive 1-associated receptor kinase 1 [Vigna unguiculata]
MSKPSLLSLHGYGILITLMLSLKLIPIKGSSYNNECEELSCGANQPPIRFPFQLVKGMHECAHPGYCLYCTQENNTMFVLPTIKLQVENIDYKKFQIYLKDPNNCLPKTLLNHFNSFKDYYITVSSSLSFFDCSSVGNTQLRNQYGPYQDMNSCPIYVTDSQASVLEWDLTFCSKMFDVPAATVSALEMLQNQLTLTWSKPACTACKKGKICKWKNNSTEVIECFDCYDRRSLQKRITNFRSFIVSTTVIVGSVLLGLLIIVAFKTFRYFREKEEDQARVDKFLEDYRAEKPTRFTYADVKRITGGFKEKLGEGAHGAVFRGKLSNEILVAVKIINNTDGDGNEFINEVGIMGKIHHINVVRLLGFCAEGIHRALVYNFFPKGSLQSFIFPPDDKDNFLGWEKMQRVALGIAKGIEYLHQGCNHPIIHFDINPRNVLLDDNFTPKISDFGLAKLCSKNRSLVSMTAARGTLGYIAPEVFSRNFGNVSYKSDIYSYGMLLLEMVGGRKNVDTSSPQNIHVLYPDWIYNLVDGDVHIHVEDEDDVKIAKKLAIVGLWCIQWQPVNRPSMKSVIQMLERFLLLVN